MKLLDRYILKRYLAALAACLSAFILIQLVYDLLYHFSKLVDSRISVGKTIAYYMSFVSPTLEFMLPAAILLATLYTLWQLSRHGELTAMRASGISLYRLMAPLLTVAVLCSLGLGILKETVLLDAALWAHRLRAYDFVEPERQPINNMAYYNTRDRRLWAIGEMDLKAPNTIHGVKVTMERPDGTLLREWHAERADYLDGQWWFFDARVQDYSAEGNPRGAERPLPESAAGIPTPFTREHPRDFENEVKPWEYMNLREMFAYLRAHPDISRQAATRMKVDLHLRFAVPWACLVVGLFGIPAGVRSARQSIMVSILTTLLCFFLFYALMQVGVFMGKRMLIVPWLAAWASNLVFLVIGIRMLYAVR